MSQVPVPRKDPQGRSWCVVLWVEEQAEKAKALPGVAAMVIGREKCPTSGDTHWHVYVRFAANKRFSWWQREFPNPETTTHKNDFQLRKGTEQQAADYARKDGDVLVDFGVQADVVSAGDTTEHVLDLLEASTPDYEIYRQHRKFFFHHHAKITAMSSKMKEWSTQGRDFKRQKTTPTTEQE